MTDEPLHFLPYLRTGLSGLLEGDPAIADAAITLAPSLRARSVSGGTQPHALPDHSVSLLGPGAITGLKPSAVARRDPPPDATGVEPNYFVTAECAAADLPWRYTPGGPDGQDRLSPWLALVVVEIREGVSLTAAPGQRAGVLTIDEAARELPPLGDAWSWAHVQYRGDLGADPETVLAERLASGSPALRSRLICPRRLHPGTAYRACLVPTFEAGRLAGLGLPGSRDHGPAWMQTDEDVTLPVYDSWQLSTGARGDFEALVQRLQPREAAGEIGLRKLRLDNPGGGLPELPGAATLFGGALVSPEAEQRLRAATETPEPEAMALARPLAAAVNAALDRLEEKAGEADPVLAPPAYGGTHAGNPGRIDPDAGAKHWFDGLNSRPEHRVVAALGAEVARENQEEFLDRAWDAAKSASAANTQLNVSQISREVGMVSERRLAALGTQAERMRLAAPAFDAMPGGAGAATVNAQLTASAIPNGIFSAALRRATRPTAALSRQASDAQPAAIAMTTAFLNDPLGAIGAFRDAPAPAGLDPAATEAPRYQADPTGATPGTVYLHRPAKRAVEEFTQTPGTDGLTSAVTAGQDSNRLLAGALRQRIPALTQLSDPVPSRLDLSLHFTEPVYRRLLARSLEALVPGVGEIPPDTATILYPNPSFLRAFLVGLNQEMAREFLWREFPTPLDTTWFRNFWNGTAADIAPIADWEADWPLAGPDAPRPGQDEFVLVLRGALPARYPDFRLYAIPAVWDSVEGPDGAIDFRREAEGGTVKLPHFAGSLAEDVHFFGFPLGAAQARGSVTPGPDAGYFLAFEELPGAPRFGLEVAEDGAAYGTAPADWTTISWADVTPGGAERLADFLVQGATGWMGDGVLRPGNWPDPDTWATDAAALARQTLQRPARVLIHASAMLP